MSFQVLGSTARMFHELGKATPDEFETFIANKLGSLKGQENRLAVKARQT